MVRGEQIQTVKPDDSAAAAMRLMNEVEAEALAVVEEGNHLVGVIRQGDLTGYLRVTHELGMSVSDHDDRWRAA